MPKDKPSLESIEPPFKSEAFKAAWNEWMEYRTAHRFRKYVPVGLKRTYSRLVRLSGNNESIAIAIINESMELNYQGFFPLKEQTRQNVVTERRLVI
jgi:hypothetical protein